MGWVSYSEDIGEAIEQASKAVKALPQSKGSSGKQDSHLVALRRKLEIYISVAQKMRDDMLEIMTNPDFQASREELSERDRAISSKRSRRGLQEENKRLKRQLSKSNERAASTRQRQNTLMNEKVALKRKLEEVESELSKLRAARHKAAKERLEPVRPILKPHLDRIAALEKQLDKAKRKINRLKENAPDLKRG
jgi:chromosome segregation ATPase